MRARIEVHESELKKSGKNEFAGYSYFELGDFLLPTMKAFDEQGLCGICSFTEELATLTITDIESGEELKITSPMGSAKLKGCHEVQNIGAVETYQRRYLWATAIELVEKDVMEAGVVQRDDEATRYITKNQRDELLKGIEATRTDMKSFCEHYGVESLQKLPVSQYRTALDTLSRKYERQQERAQNNTQSNEGGQSNG